jgi:hypothetical protein
LAVCGVNDRLKGMPKRYSAQAHSVFDEFISVHIPDVAALSADDERGGLLGKLIVALGVGMSATGNNGMGARGQTPGLEEIQIVLLPATNSSFRYGACHYRVWITVFPEFYIALPTFISLAPFRPLKKSDSLLRMRKKRFQSDESRTIHRFE